MTARDDAFLMRVTAAADAAVDALADGPEIDAAPLGPHRESMRRTKLFVAAFLAPGSRHRRDDRLLARAAHYADRLGEMQARSGLFTGGNNLESPPDSAFTINDVCDIVELTTGEGAFADVRESLLGIVSRATPALVAGGVHTPNHRWELAAALARVHRIRPDDAVLARVNSWLAEGIDIDDDGLYSERSANYAAYVSNPSLMALGDILGRGDLHDVVERALASMIGTIHPDGSVETVHSRRQDQQESAFPLAPFLVPYRRLAVERLRADFAWAAMLAERAGIREPQTVLAEALLVPSLAQEMPDPVAPAAASRASWRRSRLVIDDGPRRRLVTFAGSDHARMGRVRSGLANNPTFLRMFAGDVVLESARLSRDFFGLGPFRASTLDEHGDEIHLAERLEGRYYQPLDAAGRSAEGAYRLVDEGRFAAEMAFDERVVDTVTLLTRISVVPTAEGVDLEIVHDGPALPWALELAFRAGGRFDGGDGMSADTVRLAGNDVRYVSGRDAVVVSADVAAPGTAAYMPGEEYEFLGGTDAAAGPRLYVTGRAPGGARVSIVRE